MSPTLQRQSAIPLYHQIAEAIRYRISTGALPPGSILPPLREAAALWGANLHTVRRAYQELAQSRLVATRVPQGTVVLPPESPTGERTAEPAGRERFLQRVLREARSEHGLSPEELIALLGRRAPALSRGGPPRVFVAECSETQSRDLAGQLQERWEVHAVPWTIDRPAPPGGDLVVATYFHYREIAHHWSGRLAEVQFLTIRPDPGLAGAVRRLAETRPVAVRSGGGRVSVLLCEREEAMLDNIRRDLEGILSPDRFRLLPRLVPRPTPWLQSCRTRGPILLSPRLWGELGEVHRRDPRVLEVRYLIDARELAVIGSEHGWRQK